MVVVGNRGRGELTGLLLGSVSLAVAAQAECPVIVVRGAEQNLAGGFGQVVVGVDSTEDSAAVLGFALHTAERRGAVVRAVHAWRHPARGPAGYVHAEYVPGMYQRNAEDALEEALREQLNVQGDRTVHRDVIEGRAQTVLLDAARTADLLVVGARRRTGRVGMQLGFVNHAVLHRAGCPVAVVPHS